MIRTERGNRSRTRGRAAGKKTFFWTALSFLILSGIGSRMVASAADIRISVSIFPQACFVER
ncbi:MAG: hypothetical protein KJ704_02605, partial [Proteobacteria bacterium]|nr:hypothetical protein [Pseudomonadota bacterium]